MRDIQYPGHAAVFPRIPGKDTGSSPTLGQIAAAEERLNWGATAMVASMFCMIARRKRKTRSYHFTT